MQSLAPPDGTASTLRACLGMYLLDERPGVYLAAEIMGLSSRSLQRALHKEGTSWSAVLELVRFDVARHLLEENELPMSEIALRLGYSEQSAFTRAFRHWAGVAPNRYRRQQGTRAAT